MKQTIAFPISLVVVLAAATTTLAGELEPPGPPTSTPESLQKINDRLLEVAGFGAVLKSGQDRCFDAAGYPIDCAGTGQDGEHQTGVTASPRFTDNGDGTVRDNLTGLLWLKDAGCFGTATWENAVTAANSVEDGMCGLTDGSAAGDWRLPNVRELDSLSYYEEYSKIPSGHPFTNFLGSYWSSTSYKGAENDGWMVALAGPVGPD